MEKNGNSKIIFFISVILIMCGFCIPSRAGVIYVDDDATGVNNGSSWSDAYNFLQDALAVASATDVIKVAQGIYMPDLGGGNTPGDKQATFQLINGVTIEGGYGGIAESDPNTRDTAKYETILSGDLNGDDGPDFENNSENSCHVVTGSFTDETTILDGFTIEAGNDTTCHDDPPRGGAGMRVESGSPTISNCLFTGNDSPIKSILLNFNGSNPALIHCTFSHNHSSSNAINNIASSPTLEYCTFEYNRTGMENRDESNPTLNNCTFNNNLDSAINQRSGSLMLTGCQFNNNTAFWGGGISCMSVNELIISNCTFSGNSARSTGGGLFVGADITNIYNCTFTGNSADHEGGGISCSSNTTLTNCVFSGNEADIGGGIDCSGNPTIINCIISKNNAERGGGINCSGNPIIQSCVFSGNTADEGGGIYSSFGDFKLNNCVFEGNTADQGGGIYMLFLPVYQLISNCTFYGNRGENGLINMRSSHGVLNLEGCILWNNGPDPIDDVANVTYSDVQGGWLGEGNIDVDPLFVSPGYWADVNDLSVVVEPEHPNAVWVKGDYHLQSQAGHWDSQSWVQDQVTSPCVDAGNPMAPIGLEPFPNGAIFNMGAYGHSVEASKTYFGSPVCDIIIPGDINGDCVVDFKDLEIVVLNWMLKGEDFVNSPPTVTLLEPQDGAQIVWPGPTLFRAEADDSDGQVVSIGFRLEHRTENSMHGSAFGGTMVNNNVSEREYTWQSGVPYGSWTVWAEATDDKGAVGVSSKITVTLIEP